MNKTRRNYRPRYTYLQKCFILVYLKNISFNFCKTLISERE